MAEQEGRSEVKDHGAIIISWEREGGAISADEERPSEIGCFRREATNSQSVCAVEEAAAEQWVSASTLEGHLAQPEWH